MADSNHYPESVLFDSRPSCLPAIEKGGYGSPPDNKSTPRQ